MTKTGLNPPFETDNLIDQLVHENKMLRDALDAISDGFIVFDANDRVIAFNTKHRALFPSFAAALENVVAYKDLLQVQADSGLLDDARGREDEWIIERVARHQVADGTSLEQVFAEGRIMRLNEYRTSSGGIVAVRTDITDLKMMQRQLQESERKFRTLLETAPIPLVLVADGKYVYANERTYDLLGVAEGELIGRRTREFYADPEVHTQALALLTKTGRVENFEVQLRRDNGELLWVTVSSAPIVYNGAPAVFAGMVDITLTKQSENALLESEGRFRAIAESSPIPMIITRQRDGEIMYANGQAKLVLAAADDNIVGKSVAVFLEDPTGRESRAAAVAEKGYLDRLEIMMRRSDGTCFPTTHSLRSIVFDGVPAIVGAFIDIAEQQKAELDLRQAKEEAANAIKSQFLAVMSHELRTPLNEIIGFSEMMSENVFGPLGHERYDNYAKDIFDSGTHLLELLSDILDLSRIEAGHMDRDETMVDMADIVFECISLLRARAKECGVDIQTHAPDRGPKLMADRTQAKQIVLNLLSNAIKYTTAGTTIDIHLGLEASGELALRIIDQGPGIPVEDIERILEPFTRLEGTHTSRVEGSGLGLAIAKSLVEGHGGRLKLVSEVDRGTEAIVIFPAGRVKQDTE